MATPGIAASAYAQVARITDASYARRVPEIQTLAFDARLVAIATADSRRG